MNDNEDIDVGDDLRFTRKGKQPLGGGGTYIGGSLNGHRFEALVFPEHADNPEWELGDSKISKLWIKRLEDGKTVFNWDRGADVPAENKTVQQIVDFLCAGLAEHTFTK